jgi:pyroglutamyl-peptidase
MAAMTREPPRVLLTGFEPFGDDPDNPSWDAVRRLHGRRVAGHRVVAFRLPVEFGTSLRALRAAIRETRPAMVLSVGLAGGRAQLSLERVAVNLDDARIPDNAGHQPVDTPVIEDGPAAYFSTLPLKAMLLALRAAGIPAEVSHSAGTYVCNHVFYGLMHALRTRPAVRAGFVHIPYAPEQATRHPGAPSLALDTVVEGMRLAIRTALATKDDARVAAGREH